MQMPQHAPADNKAEELPELINQAMQIITQIGQMMQAQGLPPEKMKQIAALARAFQMFASGEADQPAPAPKGAAPMEAGVNPNARPAL